MSADIGDILDSWDYQPGQVTARRFTGKDGAAKLQLRIDMGLMQMHVEGRPDGKRPMGCADWLEYWQRKAERLKARGEGPPRLDTEAVHKLQQECIQYHHRYICLYQLGDYPAVANDAERNLRAIEFVASHAETRELGWALRQFYPQAAMMRARGLGMQWLAEKRHDEALAKIDETLDDLHQFFEQQERGDEPESCAEAQSLIQWREEIRTQRPLTEAEQLRKKLDVAIEAENYEEAARVRDALRRLEARR